MIKKALTALVLSIMLCLCTYAAEKTVIENFEDHDNLIKYSVYSVTNTEIVKDENNCVLSVHSAKNNQDTARKVTFKLENQDLSAYKFIKAEILLPESEANNFEYGQATVTVYTSNGNHTEQTENVNIGILTEIICDITNFENANEINKIEISVKPVYTENDKYWGGNFLIDNISADIYTDTEMSKRFSFENITYENAELVFADDKKSFDVRAIDENADIVLDFDVSFKAMANANALRIVADNASVILLKATNGTETVIETVMTDTSPIHSEYYAQTDNLQDITHITLSLPTSGESVTIYSINFTSVYDPKPYDTHGNINKCKYENGNIIIEGYVERGYFSDFEDRELLLYALDPHEDVLSFDYNSIDAISRRKFSSNFTFTVDTQVGDQYVLDKKFVVKLSGDNLFVDTPKYVQDDTNSPETSTMKLGITNASLSDTVNSFAQTTIIDVHLDRLINTNKAGYMYKPNDISYYFNNRYIEEIKNAVFTLKDSGINIAVRLLISSNTVNSIVYPNAKTDAVGYFPYIKDSISYDTLKSAVEFLLTELDAKNGTVRSVIVGDAVNSGKNEIGENNMSITEFANVYADILRLVKTACKNIGAAKTIPYASFSDIYRHDLTCENVYSTHDMIKALSLKILDEGSFLWGICISGNSHSDDAFTKYIGTEDIQTTKAFLSDIETVIGISSDVIYTDACEDSASNALSRAVEMTNAGLRGSYVIKLNDKNLLSDIANFRLGKLESFDKEVFPFSDYEKLTEGNVLIKTVYSESIPSSEALSTVGKYVYNNFDSYTELDGFRQSFSTKHVRITQDTDDRYALLAEFDANNLQGGSVMGVGATPSFPYLFNLTPIISFDIKIKADTDNIPVTLRFSSKNTVHDIKFSSKAGEWQTVYADMSDYANIEFNNIQIFLDLEGCESAQLLIDEISGYSAEHNDKKLQKNIDSTYDKKNTESMINKTVVMLFILVLATLITLTVILSLRQKNKEREALERELEEKAKIKK